MASRKEQKEQLRKEREAREAAANAEQRRKRLIGYGVGGGIVLVAVIAAIVLIAGGGGDGGGGGDSSADVLPDGGSFPEFAEAESVEAAAKQAGCELQSFEGKSREHVSDLETEIEYSSKPPTSGSHFADWAEDGAYEDPPDIKRLVHALEHGRIIIWFKEDLPSEQRASLKAYYDDDVYQMIISPDVSGMTYEVAASAWNGEPTPNGTGRLLACPKYNDDVYAALEAFKDEHRSRGPEPVP